MQTKVRLNKVQKYIRLNQVQRYSCKKISIIEFYLLHTTYSTDDVARHMSLSFSEVNATINEWQNNNKTITVASKLCD